MPKKFQFFLQGDNIYICKKCQTHLASLNDLVSKAFRGQYGTAYLFHDVVNLDLGTTKNQNLATGQHTIADIYCKKCKNSLISSSTTPIGWKYVRLLLNMKNYVDKSIRRRPKIQIRKVYIRRNMYQADGRQLIKVNQNIHKQGQYK